MDGEGHHRGVLLMLPIANRGCVWNILCTHSVMGSQFLGSWLK